MTLRMSKGGEGCDHRPAHDTHHLFKALLKASKDTKVQECQMGYMLDEIMPPLHVLDIRRGEVVGRGEVKAPQVRCSKQHCQQVIGGIREKDGR